MGTCPMTSGDRVYPTSIHSEMKMSLGAAMDLHDTTFEHSSPFHELPPWVDANPFVTSSMAKLIRDSWNNVISDNVNPQYAEALQRALDHSSQGGPRGGTTETSVADDKTIKSIETRDRKDSPLPNGDREHDTTPTAGRGRQKSAETETASSTGPMRSKQVLFFDLFFRNWNLLDPAIDLVFSDLRARSQVMSRMIAFMTTKCDKFNDPETMVGIRQIAWAHHRSGVSAEQYNNMVQTHMLTMKRALGRDFTTDVQRAWLTAFSKFFLLIFPLLPATKTIRVRAADKEPEVGRGAGVVKKGGKSPNAKMPPVIYPT